jgi:hypothetical protein
MGVIKLVEFGEEGIDYKEIKLSMRKIFIRIYENGLIRIEQLLPLSKVDYVEIDEAGMILVYPEKII